MSSRAGGTAVAQPVSMSLSTSPGKLPPLEARGMTYDWMDGDGQQGLTTAGTQDNVGLPSLVSGEEQARKQPYHKGRNMPYAFKSQHSHPSSEDDKPKVFNPAPVPFQPQTFQSSTMIKRVSVSRRHGEMWSGHSDNSIPRTKGFVIHTDRYKPNNIPFEEPPKRISPERLFMCPEDLSQRERMQAELHFMERIRGMKRKGQMTTHRENCQFLMGGRKVNFSERMDIMGELKKLKCVALPTRAKELYVGRGFTLPQTHALNKVKAKKTSIIKVPKAAAKPSDDQKEKPVPKKAEQVVEAEDDKGKEERGKPTENEEKLAENEESKPDVEDSKPEEAKEDQSKTQS